jgi:hypothetical protein
VSEISILPPLIDSGRPGYIRRERKSTKPSIVRSKVAKKKVKKNNSLLET